MEFNETIDEIGLLEHYRKDFAEKVPLISYRYSGSAYAIKKPPTIKELSNYERKKKHQNKYKR
jgi:hypothetical protein